MPPIDKQQTRYEGADLHLKGSRLKSSFRAKQKIRSRKWYLLKGVPGKTSRKRLDPSLFNT